ncbi:MAG: glycosyltransferase family 9 protein [Deltaproteobacteria bacterium]|nr:MAG: glycosyltransferase family 9 protein [Deltaproteobacteria bacterium]TNF28103.1 MAG: glycosyltransferase family 9 protein [Deltaproteobacteria bacterium]
MKKKILIIRFSSFGDIVQAMSVLRPLKTRSTDSEIHWLTRSEFSNLVTLSPYVDRVISFDKKSGLLGLIKLGFQLRSEGYELIYDAHRNTRSAILRWIFLGIHIVSRPKSRWKRILLFTFRINKFPWPFRGMKSYLEPLRLPDSELHQQWSFSSEVTTKVDQLVGENFVCLAPSAAWEMKRWPLSHWKELINLKSETRFVVLGGPADTFCEELVQVAPERVSNLAGKLSLIESCYAVSKANALVSADTGLIHVADILGVKGLSLVGPTAFGFPTNSNIETLEVDLPCRPCSKDGRGGCSQEVWQKCMVDIRPEAVSSKI